MRALPFRSLLCLALGSAIACAPRVRALEGPRPASVLVISSSAVPTPGARSVLGGLFGSDSVQAVAARSAESLLAEKGYRVATPAVLADGALDAERLGALLRQVQADAALEVALLRLDTSALGALGQAELVVEVRLVDATGRMLWAGRHSGSSGHATYRAQNDWRAHLRGAVARCLGEMP